MDILLRARAKINIALDVLGKRQDGYHDLSMVMQTVDFFDTVYIKKIEKPKIKVVTNLPWLPVNEANLAYRAAEAIKEKQKIPGGFFINLMKRIPVSAGLAGGSADCAAVLVGIRNMCRLPVSNAELMNIGKNLGADVPFCIMRGTALAEGIGDRLTPLPPHPKAYILLVKPPINVATASVFNSFDFAEVTRRPNIETIINGLYEDNLDCLARELCNVLESVTMKNHSIVGDIKAAMIEMGAVGSLMSGSGPTVFGYFRTRAEALVAMEGLKNRFGFIHDMFLTRIFN